MTLVEQYPETFEKLPKSPLRSLMEKVEIFDFEKSQAENSLEDKIGVGPNIDTATFLKAFSENQLDNFVQTSNDDIAYEFFIASIILKKPRLFLNNPVTLLNSQGTPDDPMRVFAENFNSNEHKSKIMDGVDKFIEGDKKLTRLRDNIAIVIDELFSNAMFNAPCDDTGMPLFRNMARNAKVRYPGDKNSRIFLVHAKTDLFVGCLDPFGSIHRNLLLKTLEKSYSVGEVQNDPNGGKGAGFGLRMMLDRSRSLYIVSEYLKRTLIVCHMRSNVSLKKIETIPKQVHINSFR